MKRLISCLALLFLVTAGFSQRVYFIYLQSEPEQAFYVKIKDNVFSSTASGYLILSKLRDSTYSFTIGFPQNKWPEQQFKTEIRGKDHGYLVKNFEGKGWGLFDLQTLSVQMGTADVADKSTKTELKDVSVFTDVLSKAANDPSLREKPVAVKKEEPPVVINVELKEKDTPIIAVVSKNEPAVKNDDPPSGKETAVSQKPDTPVAKETITEKKEEPPVSKETVTLKKPDPPAVKETVTEKKDDPVVLKETVAEKPKESAIIPVVDYQPSVVKRKSESSTSEGFGLTFVDEYADGKKDTIRIIIPALRGVKMVVREEPKEQPKEKPKEEKKFLDITADTKDASTETNNVVDKKTDKTDKEKKAEVVKKCVAAGESDFLKLRKKMAAETNDDAMVSEAVKYFKSKCFAVTQLKNLSTLFLNDAGKYKFFDAAYTHVSDPENFTSLQAELKDDYYINRFKAMLR